MVSVLFIIISKLALYIHARSMYFVLELEVDAQCIVCGLVDSKYIMCNNTCDTAMLYN
jgi:hypothetical protein